MWNHKTRLFETGIMDFWRKAGREHLPWRRHSITAYEVWVSEIMLQQTQVSRVIGYYEKFLRRFPTVRDLAKASWEEFLPYYAGLGYYRRGQNMLLAAKKIVEEYGGEFPRDKQSLMKLPGVGDYTASAIMSFVYGEDHLAWDTNLNRVIGRFFFGNKDAFGLSKSGVVPRFLSLKPERKVQGTTLNLQDVSCRPELISGSLGSRNEFGMTGKDFFERAFKTSKKDLNAALMDFGSAICLGRPKCNACPLVRECMYFQEKGRREVQTLKQVQGDNLKDQGGNKVDWKNAQVFLWLHKDHKVYYSARPKRFEVFVLPAAYNSRAGIKEYFKETYGLDLAVRPPHKKTIIKRKPTMFVNAQILLGTPRFATFSKDAVKAYNESM